MLDNLDLVVIDLETTGLDNTRDRIIEVGAIRFRGDRVVDTFEQLVNPGRQIPSEVVRLTGINDAMVSQAPAFEDIREQLKAFIGEDPVVGHNVRFDVGFLQRQRLAMHNEAIDTYAMAAALMPKAGRYSLGSLATALNVPRPQGHRALVDTTMTMQVFRRLVMMTNDLPYEVLSEIVWLGQQIDWGAGYVFEAVLEERNPTARPTPEAAGPLFAAAPDRDKWHPLNPVVPPTPLAVEPLAELLGPDGGFAAKFPGYEHRPQQVAVMREVATAINRGRHLMVEAGTGTGKSMAYLVPAVHWALQNEQRVVVSTATINLQEQLISKDLPTLKEVLGRDFRVALLKGRSNYLCPRRLTAMRRRQPGSVDEVLVLAKLLVWMSQGGTGDRGELSLRGREFLVWQQLNADDEHCTGDKCSELGGVCPYYISRRRGEAAHVMVVNHALLMSDVANNNHILPESHYVVIDEAHHLEATATDALAYEATVDDVERWFRDLGSMRAGALGHIRSSTERQLTAARFEPVRQLLEDAYAATGEALDASQAYFAMIAAFVDGLNERDTGYTQQVRLTPKLRDSNDWYQVMDAAERLATTFNPLTNAMARLTAQLMDYELYLDDVDMLTGGVTRARLEMGRFADEVVSFAIQPEDDRIHWVERATQSKRVSMHLAPLAVGPLLQEHLFSKKASVVMTSATLTTAGDFEYMKSRLEASDAATYAVDSPFDYLENTLLYLPTDVPEPNERHAFQKAVETGLIDLCTQVDAHVLVLMTSYAQLRTTAAAIRPRLERKGILVYDQADGSSRQQLLNAFRAGKRTVLLGTKSFWEGVDLPGAALEVLVIVKLPFDVPSDPIFAARSETFDNAFMQYSVPEAILKLRQGFGRLIRTKRDFGVVAILDRRVMTKRYGSLFLESLPATTKREGPLAALGPTAAAWLKRHRADGA